MLGLVQTTGSVGLVAESDILDGNGGGTVNVSADMLVMVADSDSDTEGMIGQDDMLNGMPDVNDNAIDTQVTTLAARAAEGIYILEVDGLTIGTSAAFDVTRVNFNSTSETVTTPSLSGLTTTGNGPIKVVTLAGIWTWPLRSGPAATCCWMPARERECRCGGNQFHWPDQHRGRRERESERQHFSGRIDFGPDVQRWHYHAAGNVDDKHRRREYPPGGW